MTDEQTKEEKRQTLIKALEKIAAEGGGETGHMEADALLLDFIGDKDVEEAYGSIPNMWYA